MQPLLLPSVLFLVTTLAAQTPFTQVVPASAAATEGPTATALPFGSAIARRVLHAYDGSTVGWLRPVRISGVAFRCDGATAGASVQGRYTYTLDVSTGLHPVGALDNTFDNNHGADRINVHSGLQVIAAPAVGAAPNAFSLHVTFPEAFEWDARRGPLLLDFGYSASTPAFGAWDAVSTGVGGLSANGATATTAGSVLTAAPVLQLDLDGAVTPSGFATVFAQSNSAHPWNENPGIPVRTLNLYEASVMPFTGRQRITALAWRTESAGAFHGRNYDLRITLSTASRTASNMSALFASNIGNDAVVVFDGTLVAGSRPSSTNPRLFELSCELQRPFEYDPALGSLSVDIQLRNSTGTTGGDFDCTLLSSIAAGRITSTAGATATTATLGPQQGTALVMAMRTVPVPTAPLALANATNTASNFTNIPFGTAPARGLQMISAADAGITQPTFVRHLRFRPSSVTTFGPSTFTCTIDLSNPTNTPATISATFDANHGPNRVRVFNGQFSVPFGTRLVTSTGFPVEVNLDRPFLWDPAGHPYLCIDMVVTARAGPGIPIETTLNVTADDARVTTTSLALTTGTHPDPGPDRATRR